MKKFLLPYVVCSLLVLIGCTPKNPPINDECTSVINLCYTSMGNSGIELLQELAQIGINVPEVYSPYDQYKCYRIENKLYELDFATIDDKVVILHYNIFFKDTYVNGWAKYLNISNLLINYKWAEWMGTASEYYSEMDNIEQRPDFIHEVTEIIASYNKSHLSIMERGKSRINSDVLYATWEYWANDPAGKDSDTGKCLSSIYDSGIMVEFEIRPEDHPL